jgi:hypothetical protein
MAPSSIAARRDETRATEVCEVTRNLWLIYLESFDTRTDAYFFVTDQVNQTQSGVVRKGFEKRFKLDFLLTHPIVDGLRIACWIRFLKKASSSGPKRDFN